MFLGVGLTYLSVPRLLTYHQAVLGVRWADLGLPYRRLFLALLRGAGLCGLATGLSVLTLLLIPYQHGEQWARRAIPGLALIVLVPTAYQCLALAIANGTPTPWPFPLLAIGLVLLAWSLSRGSWGPAR
jgi:hypothetical protein